jgi:hypothetical protein
MSSEGNFSVVAHNENREMTYECRAQTLQKSDEKTENKGIHLIYRKYLDEK